jgi:hypothetical protein
MPSTNPRFPALFGPQVPADRGQFVPGVDPATKPPQTHRARRFASMAPSTVRKATPDSAPPRSSGAPTEHPPASSAAELGVVPELLLDAGGVVEPEGEVVEPAVPGGVVEPVGGVVGEDGTHARREALVPAPASSMHKRVRHVPANPFTTQAESVLASAQAANCQTGLNCGGQSNEHYKESIT